MSQAQERRKAETWRDYHEPIFNENMAALHKLREEIEKMDQDSEECKKKKEIADEKSKSLEAYFMQFFES